MKIIDKTPYQTEKGEISLLDRLQGTLKYGFSWYPELEAQKNIIVQLDRTLEKGFVLIRNLTLPGSAIVEPIILLGPGGVYVIYVTPLRGFYEAKGDQWNIVNNKRPRPAPINLISRVARLAQVLQRYLAQQGIELPVPIEPVLVASDPGLQIDSMRPAVKAVQSDGVRQLVASWVQAPPVLKTEYIYDLADRIVSPRPKAAQPAAPAAGPAPAGAAAAEPAARANAIFQAAGQAQPFKASDLSFAFQEESAAAAAQPLPQVLRETSPSQARPRRSSGPLGFSLGQWALLGVLGVVGCCMAGGFSYLIFFSK
jgi:hypothetical protein